MKHKGYKPSLGCNDKIRTMTICKKIICGVLYASLILLEYICYMNDILVFKLLYVFFFSMANRDVTPNKGLGFLVFPMYISLVSSFLRTYVEGQKRNHGCWILSLSLSLSGFLISTAAAATVSLLLLLLLFYCCCISKVLFFFLLFLLLGVNLITDFMELY